MSSEGNEIEKNLRVKLSHPSQERSPKSLGLLLIWGDEGDKARLNKQKNVLRQTYGCHVVDDLSRGGSANINMADFQHE